LVKNLIRAIREVACSMKIRVAVIAQPNIIASAKAPCRRAERTRLDYAVGACAEREVGGGAEFAVVG
jgi:hypothetical protein